jgi:endonuclease/exonuclease/phosphatase family metal-dependent hydrolase
VNRESYDSQLAINLLTIYDLRFTIEHSATASEPDANYTMVLTQKLARTDTAPSVDLELGDFAARDLTTAAPARLIVATYNIRYAVGSFLISGGILRRFAISRPGRRPALVARNLAKAAHAFSQRKIMPAVDVIALQEADRGTTRAGGRHVAEELARLLKMRFARAATPTPTLEEPKKKQWYLDFEERIRVGEQGDTGVAILSRLPLERAERIELPWADCPWRPRLAMTASVPFADRVLHVFNAHIDPHASLDDQLAQHRAILDFADEKYAQEPSVILGDFNTLIPAARNAARSFLESRGFESPLSSGVGTWRAGPLRLHADWIFVRGAKILRCGVARRLRVSDHWPVWAELEA